MFQCFEVNFRSFERDLSRRVRARLPSLIFRDVQRTKACHVTTSVEGSQASVVQVDPSDFSIEVDQERCWRADAPVFVDGSPYKPLHVEADKVWLDRLPPVKNARNSPGDPSPGVVPRLRGGVG